MGVLRFTILGCGSSAGVPRIGRVWGKCDPHNPRNKRRRCSLLIERQGAAGSTIALIDTSPDMRAQLLGAGIDKLDGVFYTHSHADHVHGIDDLRQIVFTMENRLSVWANEPTGAELVTRFGYLFETPAGSSYPPILNLHIIDSPVTISGDGGDITLIPFAAEHGSITALGYRIGPLAYLPDGVALPPASWTTLDGIHCWIVDALRRKPHPSHAHLALSLEWLKQSGAARGILTNMHLDMDYDELLSELPPHVEPAYDGMVIEYDLPDRP